MKYVKMFTDYEVTLRELNDEELGRLMRAMFRYAQDGTLPQFQGNERFIWPMIQQTVDREAEAYDNKVSATRRARQQRSQQKQTEDDAILEKTDSVSSQNRIKN